MSDDRQNASRLTIRFRNGGEVWLNGPATGFIRVEHGLLIVPRGDSVLFYPTDQISAIEGTNDRLWVHP